MPTKQITGLGPRKTDGSIYLFTTDPQPFIATAEWLAAQSSFPAVGDELQIDGESVKLMASSSVTTSKKEVGSGAPTPPSAPSLTVASGVKPPKAEPVPENYHRYRANPVEVEAFTIVSVSALQKDGSMNLALDNGENVVASKEMLARYIPIAGDYWVVQTDGYVYLNPKEVFERKYATLR